MTIHMHRTAEITIELPREQTMALFTAEGERRWADGWDPDYPDASRREGPGAVFTTEHGDHGTTWIMVDQRPDAVRYARVTDGLTAGTVAVSVRESHERATRVLVTYDLTALTAAGQGLLESFDAEYEGEISSWATRIAAALEAPAPLPAVAAEPCPDGEGRPEA